jgi:murein DD-endopeptidase MepM/ murein hydrolase activator NlpD
MRFSISSNISKTTGKFLVAAFLASAATGCSSDASRFGGMFGSSGSDTMATGSIPRRNLSGLGGDPVPRAGVASGQPDYGNGSDNSAYNQPYPAQPQTYKPAYSSARVASAPAVQRSELAAPAGIATSDHLSTRPPREEQQAMAQPYPSSTRGEPPHALAPPRLAPDHMATGTTLGKPSAWTGDNAPSVTLGPSENTATLARRYGVPEKEILRVNGLQNSASAQPGRVIVIPTMNGGGNVVKASSQTADLSKGGKQPMPTKAPEQDAAVLPNGSAARDKQSLHAENGAGKLAAGAGKDPTPGGYVVKPGDSLAKIAKATGTHIDALKQANTIGKGGIQVGQTLKLPHGSMAPAADQIRTASIAPEKAPVKAAAPVAAAEEPTKVASLPTQSVTDAQKSDAGSAAPESTGIGKYRWPVRGAVIAAYGANVEGSRNDGIDISVPSGTPIKAAENGVVIYAGNGLKALGNTVLVRHDDGTVTVYGHADTLSVTRGQKVQRGQTIAMSGMSGNAKQPQMHFEVRKNASPVNPMTFLE